MPRSKKLKTVKGSGMEDPIIPLKTEVFKPFKFSKGEIGIISAVFVLMIAVVVALFSPPVFSDDTLPISESEVLVPVTTGPAVEESAGIVKGTLCGWLSNLDPAEYPTAFHYAKDGVGCGALWTGDLKGGGG